MKFKDFVLGSALFISCLAGQGCYRSPSSAPPVLSTTPPASVEKSFGIKSDSEDNRLRTNSNETLEEKVTPANLYLRSFPQKINGAKNIEKYEIPGAEKVLVHIHQVHSNPININSEILNKKVLKRNPLGDLVKKVVVYSLRKDYLETNEVQKNIFYILRDLNKKKLLKEIYIEGMDSKVHDLKLDDLKKIYVYEMDKIRRSLLIGDRKILRKYSFAPGGTLVYLMSLYYSGKSVPSFRGAENEKLLNESLQIFRDNLGKRDPALRENFKKYALEKREDALIDIVYRTSSSPLVICVYGSKHNFKDNIEKWNEKYPDKKFSLINVFPSSLKD